METDNLATNEMENRQPPRLHEDILRTDPIASKYAIDIEDEGMDENADVQVVEESLSNDMPQMNLTENPPLRLKFKRQYTFQQRQRRRIKKHAKLVAATSHSVYQFMLTLWRTFRSIHIHEFIAYCLIVCGVLSECSTPAPRYNVPIGTVLLTISIKKIEIKLLTTGLLMAILMDIIWLCRHEDISYNGTFTYSWLSFCRLWVAACLLLKAWLAISVYWYLEPHEMSSKYPSVATSRQLRRLVFQKIGYFFPTTNLPPLEDLSRHTLLRLVALLWLHVVCGIVLLFLGVLSCVSYTVYPQFRSASLGIPLHYMILLKGASTLSSVMLFVTHLHVAPWQCLRLLISLQGFKGPLIHWHGVGYGQDSSWLKTIRFMKAVDCFCGCYLLLVLYSAFHHGSGFYSGVMAVLIISTSLCIVLECWVPLLGLVIYKFIGVLEQAHRDHDVYRLLPRNWSAPDDANVIDDTSSDDEDSESSSSEDGSSSSSSDAGSDVQPTEVTWLRYYDTYNRAYIRNTITGETFWDRPPRDTPESLDLPRTSEQEDSTSPLSNTIYMTSDDFKYFWNTLPDTGGFLCRVVSIPSVDALSDHLSECRFYVITDGLASEHIRAIYFYAIHTSTLAHFLGAFLIDSLSMQLEAKFKCDQVDLVPDIVHCLNLREILGEYEPLPHPQENSQC